MKELSLNYVNENYPNYISPQLIRQIFEDGYKAAEKELFTLDQLISVGNYCYDYHKNTSFPEKSFEENCKNNLLQFLKIVKP